MTQIKELQSAKRNQEEKAKELQLQSHSKEFNQVKEEFESKAQKVLSGKFIHILKEAQEKLAIESDKVNRLIELQERLKKTISSQKSQIQKLEFERDSAKQKVLAKFELFNNNVSQMTEKISGKINQQIELVQSEVPQKLTEMQTKSCQSIIEIRSQVDKLKGVQSALVDKIKGFQERFNANILKIEEDHSQKINENSLRIQKLIEKQVLLHQRINDYETRLSNNEKSGNDALVSLQH